MDRVQRGEWDPRDVLRAYGRKALEAHKETNCLSEVLIGRAEEWAETLRTDGFKQLSQRPLAGVPISLKDTVAIEGVDSCIGYTSSVGNPSTEHAPLVRLLLDAGAIPFTKTSVPITMLSFESSSYLLGRTLNPHNPAAYSPGGSSGGESALLAFSSGGSCFGIGSDVAGSVRVPAHYCGIVSVKGSVGRFPKVGTRSAMPGQEGVPGVCAPMARTLEDLEAVWRGVMSMRPWEYDYTVSVAA